MGPNPPERNEKMTTVRTPIIPLIAAVLAAGGGAVAPASDARADAGLDDRGARHVAADEAPGKAWGSITFRSERYALSDRAVVTTSPTTIRIADDAAMSRQGQTTSLYVQLGYTFDASKPATLRISSGVAIRGYDLATGTYDDGQVTAIGPGALSLDSPRWSEATHAWGHLNSATERGIDLDVHGVHFPTP